MVREKGGNTAVFKIQGDVVFVGGDRDSASGRDFQIRPNEQFRLLENLRRHRQINRWIVQPHIVEKGQFARFIGNQRLPTLALRLVRLCVFNG